MDEPKFFYEFKTVTPDVASKWLESNFDKNRPIRKGVVKSYEIEMLQGQWTDFQADAPIVFVEDGSLIGGQHRLTAQINTGSTIGYVVARNVPASQYKTMDNGARKQDSDFVEGPNADKRTSCCRLMLTIEHGGRNLSGAAGTRGSSNGRWSPTREDVVKRATDDEFAPYCATYARKVSKAFKTSAGGVKPIKEQTVYGFLLGVHYVYDGANDDVAFSFLDDVCEFACESVIAQVFKGEMHEYVAQGVKPCDNLVLGQMIQAFEIWKDCKKAPRKLSKAQQYLDKYNDVVFKKFSKEAQ